MRPGALEKYDDQKVVGGSLAVKRFGDLTASELKKVVRKYPTDPNLRKYARAKLSLEEIGGEHEPQPCMPLRLVPSEIEVAPSFWQGVRKRSQKMGVWILGNKYLRAFVVVVCLLLLLKPPLSSLLGKYVVKSVRIVFRRLCDLVALILEGLLDEVIYQLDGLFSEALPADMQASDIPSKTAHLISHVFSALLGATFSILTARFPPHRAQVA